MLEKFSSRQTATVFRGQSLQAEVEATATFERDTYENLRTTYEECRRLTDLVDRKFTKRAGFDQQANEAKKYRR